MVLLGRITVFLLVASTSAQIGYLFSAYNLIDSIMEDFFADSYEKMFGEELSDLALTLLWSFCIALKPLGQVTGGLFLGISCFSDKYGRRKTLLLGSVISLVGMVLQGIALPLFNFIFFLIGRFLVSIAIGITVCQFGVFLTEIAVSKRRGLMGSTAAFGVAASSVLFMSLGLPSIFGTSTKWAWLCAVGAVQSLLAGFLYAAVCRESPRFLYMNGRIDEAMDVISFYQGDEHMMEVLEDLREEESSNCVSHRVTLLDLGKLCKENSVLWNLILLSATAVSAATLTSYSLFQQYSTDILQLVANLTLGQAQLTTIAIGCVAVPAALFSLLIIDRFGRRPLILISCAGILIVHIALFAGDWSGSGAICIAALFFHPALYRLGAGPVPYFISAELLPKSFRSVASVACWVIAWSCESVVLFSFTPLLRNIGFWAWLVLIGPIVLIIFILYKFLPETKNAKLASLYSNLSRSFAALKNAELLDEKTPLIF